MKVLHITASYKPAYIYGGPIMSVSQLCENLQSNGDEVTVYTTTANGSEELNVPAGKEQNVNGVRVFYFKRLTKDHSHFSPELLKTLWNKHRSYDVIHVHSWWNLVSILSVLVCWLRGRKVIVSPRGMLSDYTYQTNHSLMKKIIHGTIGNFLLKRVKFHATSEDEKRELKKMFPSASVTVIPNFVKLSDHTFTKKQNDLFKLIFLSRIDPKKGLELLFDSLKDTRINYRLYIAGTGENEYVEKLKNNVNNSPLAGNIEWMGNVQGEEKFRLLNECDLLILPSYNENFANVVIESLSVGTPVLISENVGLADYVEENDFGWICTTDPKSISGKIMQAYTDTDKRNQISETAPKKIRQDYSGNLLVSSYIELYNQIATSREPREKTRSSKLGARSL
jgi:glycosyltransferase involved in cell wall biosynthesis